MRSGVVYWETNSPARVVDDFLDDSANVAVALGKVEVAQTGGCFVEVGVRLELETE